jgi:hypothetical protein
MAASSLSLNFHGFEDENYQFHVQAPSAPSPLVGEGWGGG